MTDTCDLCVKTIEPGEPRYGAVGDGGRTGAAVGQSRHWRCHVDKFGRPGTTPLLPDKEPKGAIGLTPAPRRPVRRVLVPMVRKGPDNRSANAQREWRARGGVISEMGRRRIEIECPFCFATFWAFVWSLAGGGKRCPNCRAMHTSFGTAYPLEGNEDLTTPAWPGR